MKAIQNVLVRFVATGEQYLGPFFDCVEDALDVLLDSGNQPDEGSFHDEIHPNDTGFEKVARSLIKAASEAGY